MSEEEKKVIPYVIYVRKSTTKGSGEQEKSIPDQIEACLNYAEQHKDEMDIMLKPEDFIFETEEDLLDEDADSNPTHAELYQKTRHLYIIKEQASAKDPGARPKWNRLISLIKKGEIKGVLSYSPDRQSRNMVDGGHLIHLAHNYLVKLKYTNFSFDNNAGGRMMLGIWFVFSKQYVDKMTEDSQRGTRSSVLAGSTLGNFKYGYKESASRTFTPFYPHFHHLQKAFQMKIRDKKSNSDIADWLNDVGFLKLVKDANVDGGRLEGVNASSLARIWTDPFYYGIYIYGETTVDLREVSDEYEPMITKEEHEELLQRKYENKRNEYSKIKEENKQFYAVPKGMLIDAQGIKFNPSIPSKNKRHKKNLTILQETKPDADLTDIIQYHHIYYEMKTDKSKLHNTRFKYSELEKMIVGKLSKLRVGSDEYELFMNAHRMMVERINNERLKELRMHQMNLGTFVKRKNDWMTKSLVPNLNQEQEELINKKLDGIKKTINYIQQEMKRLEEQEEIEVAKFLDFKKILNNAKKYYANASLEQKAKICNMLFDNIVVHSKQRVVFKVKPELESIFK